MKERNKYDKKVGKRKYEVDVEMTGECEYKLTCKDISNNQKSIIMNWIGAIIMITAFIFWMVIDTTVSNIAVTLGLFLTGVMITTAGVCISAEPFQKELICHGEDASKKEVVQQNMDKIINLFEKEAAEKEAKELAQKQYEKELRESLRSLKK